MHISVYTYIWYMYIVYCVHVHVHCTYIPEHSLYIQCIYADLRSQVNPHFWKWSQLHMFISQLGNERKPRCTSYCSSVSGIQIKDMLPPQLFSLALWSNNRVKCICNVYTYWKKPSPSDFAWYWQVHFWLFWANGEHPKRNISVDLQKCMGF